MTTFVPTLTTTRRAAGIRLSKGIELPRAGTGCRPGGDLSLRPLRPCLGLPKRQPPGVPGRKIAAGLPQGVRHMKIMIADAFDESLPGRLAAFGEAFSDPARLAEADVFLIRSKSKVTREFLAGTPNLKLVIRGGVGLDNVDIEACREKKIDVKNTPRASSVAVAELAMALMLAIPNRLGEGP